MTIKKCKHCKYSKVSWSTRWFGAGQEFALCMHEKAHVEDREDFHYCITMRRFNDLCGKAGKLWEAKK